MNTPNAPEYGRILAECGWDQAQQTILSGFAHDLNGRITALGAVAQLAGMGEALPAAFSSEEERLRALCADLQLLLGDLGDRRRPLMPADMLSTVQRLVARAAGASGEPSRITTPEPSTVPPVLVQEVAMVRALVTLILRPGEDSQPGLDVVLTGDEHDVVLRLSGCDLADHDGADALAELVEAEGGVLKTGAAEVEIRLPSLKRSRAEGR